MSNKSNKYFIDEDDCVCDIRNKKVSTFNYVSLMFDKTVQMFEYKNLPDTIPSDIFELFLQRHGHCCVTEINGSLYAFEGELGGAPDPYYRSTLYIIANPALGISKSLRISNHLPPFAEQNIQGECVFVRNDLLHRGLKYINSRYATQLSENDISIRSAQINSRQQTLITAQEDEELESANQYLENLENGKITAVGEKAFLEGIKVNNVSVQSSNSIIQLIELQQYLKASWYNEIGLNSNFNMKREYLSEEELRAQTDILLPLIDNMLYCRKQAIEDINRIYGTNISVDKNSSWLNKQDEVDTAQAIEESKIEGEGGSVD